MLHVLRSSQVDVRYTRPARQIGNESAKSIKTGFKIISPNSNLRCTPNRVSTKTLTHSYIRARTLVTVIEMDVVLEDRR